MRDFERLEKVQYPLVKIPQEGKIDRNILVKDLLESPMSKNIVNQIKGSEAERLSQLLLNEEDILYVDNEYRELYLKVICTLLSKIPKFKFNINEVSKLGEPMVIREYWDDWDKRTYRNYIEYPKFNAVVRPLIQSNVCRNIESLNQIYETNLKAFNNDLKGTLIGAEGEREVAKTLKDFEKIVGREKMRILPNIRIEPNGQSVESDFIVVCPNGVFALEVKNLGSTGSYNITVEKDGLWKKVMKNGRWKEMPDSISRQNERHLMGIEQVINSKMGNSTENWIGAKSLIVFANNVVGIRNYSNNVIIRDSEIMTEIRKHPICLNEQQINEIAEILLAESLPAKKYKMENWMNKLVGVHLELVQQTQEVYPYLQEYIEIMTAYNYRIETEIPLPSYQVIQEEVSLADDESEYQKSSEELEQEKREEQERKIKEERRIRERAENFINNNQSAYGDQSYEQRYFDYDAYMRGETHSVYSEDTRK